jgi:hypothetical protein
MKLEILSELSEYFYWQYWLLVLFGVEFLKLFIVKIDSGKYVFKFDTEQRIRFSLRFAIIVVSILYGLIIVVMVGDTAILFSLFITFCITTTFYEYFYKIAVERWKIKNARE